MQKIYGTAFSEKCFLIRNHIFNQNTLDRKFGGINTKIDSEEKS